MNSLLSIPRYVAAQVILSTLLVLCGCTFQDVRGPVPPQIREPKGFSSSGRVLGHDTLGANQRHFDAASAAHAFSPGSPLGFLDNTFDASNSHAVSLLSSVHPSVVRVHFLNTTCNHTGNVCGSYEPTRGFSPASLQNAIKARNGKVLGALSVRVQQWCAIKNQFPGTLFAFSPALEHQLDDGAWNILADTTLAACPGVQLVNNPMGPHCGEAQYRGAWREAHGNTPDASCDITSLDGSELMDISVHDWLSRTASNKVTYRWTRLNNLRAQWKDSRGKPIVIDPRNRTESPDLSEFSEYAHATDPVPAAPSPQFRCSFGKFDANHIWKPASEDTGNGDARANKPVLISKFSSGASIVSLVDYRGKAVGTLGRYTSNYTDGRPRYYSGFRGGSNKHGYDFQQAAVRSSGSPYVWASAGGRCIGPFLPGRRQGATR